MRFLPSNPGRTVAEILLTVAIIGFVVYDLGGRSSVKPEASNVVLSFEAKKPSAPAASSSSSRFEVAVGGGNPVVPVCGNFNSNSNPYVVGANGTQVLGIALGGPCNINPAITIFNPTTNVTSLAGITVLGGSYLTFAEITSPSGGATSGPLVMAPGSYLETIIGAGLVAIEDTTVVYPLLLATGACPSFTNVNILPPQNCPTATGVTTGSYQCSVSAATVQINGLTYCSVFLTIAGPLIMESAEITIDFSKDCSTFTVIDFKTAIFTACGVPPKAIRVKQVACGSMTIVFVVLGSNAALIAQAVQTILASGAPGGALYILLGVTYIGLGPRPTSYYPLPYCFYNGQSYCGTTSIHPISSSNPALFALLTLLVIPVALILGIFVWCCLQKEPVCAPMPVCTPAPACYFPEPTCAVPCDPCAGAAPVAYMDAAAAPLPMLTPAPYQCQ